MESLGAILLMVTLILLGLFLVFLPRFYQRYMLNRASKESRIKFIDHYYKLVRDMYSGDNGRVQIRVQGSLIIAFGLAILFLMLFY